MWYHTVCTKHQPGQVRSTTSLYNSSLYNSSLYNSSLYNRACTAYLSFEVSTHFCSSCFPLHSSPPARHTSFASQGSSVGEVRE
jgi:hypothetical protein